jgi:hydrogenase/urease accessory protein HupE
MAMPGLNIAAPMISSALFHPSRRPACPARTSPLFAASGPALSVISCVRCEFSLPWGVTSWYAGPDGMDRMVGAGLWVALRCCWRGRLV